MATQVGTGGRGADFNVRILRTLALYVQRHHGEAALAGAAARAGLEPATLTRGRDWISHEKVDAFQQAVFDLVGRDEDRFRQAYAQSLSEAYGPLRFVLWATSPKTVLLRAMRTVHLVSAVSRYTLLAEERTSIRVRYESSRPESRLSCLGRQANSAALTTFWGLPPARIVEHSCIGNGDPACEYTVTWREPMRLLPALTGTVAGLGGALAAQQLGVGDPSLWLTLPICGGLVGHLLGLRTMYASQLRTEEESLRALRQIARDESEARQEIQSWQRRQTEWTRLIEQQIAERTEALAKVASQVEHFQTERVTAIRGMTHDLNNPLAVLKAAAALLEDEERAGLRRDPIVPASDLRGAAERMEAITREIMAVARPEGRTTRMQPVRIVVSDLVGQVQRRLRALVFGRPINASVFSNREAPEHVEIDALVLDRILDNLLTNAARYTVRGSILVEVTGTPGFLVFKVSDTGRGIAEDAIAGIFQPRGSDPTTRAAGGHGLGLSIVVGLLAEIGGRLEVLSKPGVGTTFWVYLPAAGGAAVRVEPAAARPADGNAEQLLHRVVRIRRSNG